MASHGVGNHSLAGCSFANWEAQAALTNEGLAAGGDNDDGSVRPTKKRRASLRVGMTPRSEDVGVFKCKACGKDLRPQRFEDHAPWSVILQHKWSRVASVQLISPDKDTPHCVYTIYIFVRFVVLHLRVIGLPFPILYIYRSTCIGDGRGQSNGRLQQHDS